MKITVDEVKLTAQLARLELEDREISRLTDEIDSILVYMDQLASLDVSQVEPTTHAVPLDLPLSPDEPGAQLSVEVALKNAPKHDHDHFEVPRIIEAQ